MTIDDKKTCAALFKKLFNEEIRAEDWNEEAADRLSEVVARLRECSKRMDYGPRPAGMRPGWFWLVSQAANVII